MPMGARVGRPPSIETLLGQCSRAAAAWDSSSSSNSHSNSSDAPLPPPPAEQPAASGACPGRSLRIFYDRRRAAGECDRVPVSGGQLQIRAEFAVQLQGLLGRL